MFPQQTWLTRPYWHYIRQHKKLVFLGLGSLFLTNSFETMVPWLVGHAIDQLTRGENVSAIAKTVAAIFVVTVLLSCFRYLWRIFWGRFHHTVAEDLRNQVFAKLTLLGPSYFRKHRIGQLMSLITNDVNSFRMAIGPGLLILFDGVSLVLLLVPIMISISWTWTWQTLAMMPLIPLIVNRLLQNLHVGFRQRQDRFADMSGAAQEIVSGIRVIKSYAQEYQQTQFFNGFSQEFKAACNRVARMDALFAPVLNLPLAVGAALLLLIGSKDVLTGVVSVGSFFAFYQYLQRMIWPMESIGIGLGHIQEGNASFERIRDLLEQELDVPDQGDVELAEFECLEVHNLTFYYPGQKQPAIQNLSFTIERGQTLGIVGATGCGKSTLMELLCRLYPVEPNTILINGISIERIRLQSLRRLISMVPQDPFLFSSEILENIAFGFADREMEDVQDAARGVFLDREIEALPEGYHALIGERGVNLSGGQKQRLTLARALIRHAPLVILDDTLSAVDAKTEEKILHHLRRRLRSTTAVIVSHRLSSVMWADVILVLKEGALEASGKHEELLSSSVTYQTLHQLQSSREGEAEAAT